MTTTTRRLSPPTGMALALVALSLLLTPLASSARARPQSPSSRIHSGENPLGVGRAEFRTAQEGMEMVYNRRYLEALEVFEEASIDFPDSPLGPVGRSIVFQAMMFENLDFAYERAYRGEYADAQNRLKQTSRQRSRRSWNTFLLAVHLGLDAIYLVRRGDYLTALNKAWDALESIKLVKRWAPEFHDVDLALGLYNYWRTAITEKATYLPKFGDHRAEGLAQMRQAKEKGLLATAPACLALTYSYMESKSWDAATKEALWGQERYPDNLINELVLGRLYRQRKDWARATTSYERVLAIDPQNKRVWFHIGELHYKRRKDNQAARDAYERYLTTAPVRELRAYTYYRLAMLERRERHFDQAEALLQKALETWPRFKLGLKRLKELEEERKEKSARPRELPAKT